MDGISKCLSAITFAALALAMASQAEAAEVRRLSKDGALLDAVRKSSMSFSEIKDEDFAGLMNRALGFDEGSEVRLEKVTSLPNGRRILRFEQLHQGVPLWSERVIVARTREGAINSIDGAAVYKFAPNFSAAAKLSGKDVEAKAVESAKKLKGLAVLEQAADFKSREVIHVDKNGLATPALEITFNAKAPQQAIKSARPTVLINSQTGAVIKAWNNVVNIDAEAPGGNRRTGVYILGRTGAPPLAATPSNGKCALKTDMISTEDAHGSETLGGTTAEVECSGTEPGPEVNGAFGLAADAHAFALLTVKALKDWYEVDALKAPITVVVNYGSGVENAFWSNNLAVFGTGGSRFYPLITLDIVAHELGHGITETNAGLIYADESGGLNESFSDITAMAAVAYSNERYGFQSYPADFRVGATASKSNGFLRDMCNPPADGFSIDHVSKYVEGLDVHLSSGIFNKVFCTLSRTPGWTIRKAYAPFLVANQSYWSKATTFREAAQGLLAAANNLELDANAINAALAEVGIDVYGSEVAVAAAGTKTASGSKNTLRAFCSFTGNMASAPKTLGAGPASKAVDDMIQRIVDASGLIKNFEVNEAPVPNAAAITDGTIRRVLYNPVFIGGLSTLTGTKWAAISVLAHEVGHHLNGHTLDSAGSRPRIELEADMFSGFVMQRLGASVTEAQAAISSLSSSEGSSTHPPKESRLKAVALGWSNACKADAECFRDEAIETVTSIDELLTPSNAGTPSAPADKSTQGSTAWSKPPAALEGGSDAEDCDGTACGSDMPEGTLKSNPALH